MNDPSIETQLALIRRDIADVRSALYGDGGEAHGLIKRVQILTESAERGRTGIKAILWIGGSTVAVLTALGQLKTAFVNLFLAH